MKEWNRSAELPINLSPIINHLGFCSLPAKSRLGLLEDFGEILTFPGHDQFPASTVDSAVAVVADCFLKLLQRKNEATLTVEIFTILGQPRIDDGAMASFPMLEDCNLRFTSIGQHLNGSEAMEVEGKEIGSYGKCQGKKSNGDEKKFHGGRITATLSAFSR